MIGGLGAFDEGGGGADEGGGGGADGGREGAAFGGGGGGADGTVEDGLRDPGGGGGFLPIGGGGLRPAIDADETGLGADERFWRSCATDGAIAEVDCDGRAGGLWFGNGGAALVGGLGAAKGGGFGAFRDESESDVSALFAMFCQHRFHTRGPLGN